MFENEQVVFGLKVVAKGEPQYPIFIQRSPQEYSVPLQYTVFCRAPSCAVEFVDLVGLSGRHRTLRPIKIVLHAYCAVILLH